MDFFQKRGHREVVALVPAWRKEHNKPDNRIRDQYILGELEKAGSLGYTPSRKVDKRRITPYDDVFIVQSAHEKGGVIVSNDNYRDIMANHPEWKETIEQRLIMYMFMGDLFMLAEDPAGKDGPHVDDILRIQQVKRPGRPSSRKVCPHGKKCTFGNRCRFYHPNKECPHGRKCKLGAKCSFFHPENEESVTDMAEDGKTATTPSVPADIPKVPVSTPSEVGGYYPGYPHPQNLPLPPEHLAQVQSRGTFAASPIHYNTVMPYQSSPSVSSPYSLEHDSTRLYGPPSHSYGAHTFPQYQRIQPQQNLTTYSNPGHPYYSASRLPNNGEMLHLMNPQFTRDTLHHHPQQQVQQDQQLFEMLTSILSGKDPNIIRQVMRENPHLTDRDLAVLVRLCQDRC